MLSINTFRIFTGIKVQSGRLNRFKTELNNLIYLFDGNLRRSSFFVGTKNKSILQFYFYKFLGNNRI